MAEIVEHVGHPILASIVGAFKSGWLSASWVGAPLKAAIDSAPQPSAVTWMQFKAANSSTGK